MCKVEFLRTLVGGYDTNGGGWEYYLFEVVIQPFRNCRQHTDRKLVDPLIVFLLLVIATEKLKDQSDKVPLLCIVDSLWLCRNGDMLVICYGFCASSDCIPKPALISWPTKPSDLKAFCWLHQVLSEWFVFLSYLLLPEIARTSPLAQLIFAQLVVGTQNIHDFKVTKLDGYTLMII